MIEPRERQNPFGLPDTLLRSLDALSRKPPKDETRGVLRQLVEQRDWSLEELAELLPQSDRSLLNNHIRPLAKTGELVYDARSRRVRRRRS